MVLRALKELIPNTFEVSSKAFGCLSKLDFIGELPTAKNRKTYAYIRTKNEPTSKWLLNNGNCVKRRITAGFNFRPIESTAYKFEYQIEDANDTNVGTFLASVAVGF